MYLSDKNIERGTITIYADTDNQTLSAVDEHNEQMREYRAKMKRIDLIEFNYIILNILIVCGMLASNFEIILNQPLISIAILSVHSIVFLVFAIFKRNLLICAIISILLPFLDLRFLILVTANFILFSMHYINTGAVKNHRCYPKFIDIHIKFSRENSPISDK